jgi:hypothetical protein
MKASSARSVDAEAATVSQMMPQKCHTVEHVTEVCLPSLFTQAAQQPSSSLFTRMYVLQAKLNRKGSVLGDTASSCEAIVLLP